MINGNNARKQCDKTNATTRIQGVVNDAQNSLDLAYAAGTLATPAGIAQPDAVQYAEKLQDGEFKKAVEDAKSWLKPTIKKISDIKLNDYE